MGWCPNCGSPIPEDAQFCPACGTKVEMPVPEKTSPGEQVLGVVLFGGYYKDICFTDRRVIQFEVMRDRYKFLAKALGPKPLTIVEGGKVDDVLPFIKSEIPRNQITSIELKNHGRFGRGRIAIANTGGSSVELARIDVDVDKESFGELVAFVSSVYPEVRKTTT